MTTQEYDGTSKSAASSPRAAQPSASAAVRPHAAPESAGAARPFDELMTLYQGDETRQAVATGTAESRIGLPFQETLESSFGRSLDHLQVHAGPKADVATRAIGATAFAQGSQIVLNREATTNLGTVAEEVAHTVQSSAAASEPMARHHDARTTAHEMDAVRARGWNDFGAGALNLTDPQGPAEHEARQVADRVSHGEPAGPIRVGLGGQQVARHKEGDSVAKTPAGDANAAAAPAGAPAPAGPHPELETLMAKSGEQLVREKGSNWSAVKAAYCVPGLQEQVMKKCTEFRRGFVNNLINTIRADAKYAKVQMKSVGSNNPTSDYDVTLGGPGDVDVVKEFNRRFRAHWGMESGIVFDTNLYAKDFLPVIEKQDAAGGAAANAHRGQGPDSADLAAGTDFDPLGVRPTTEAGKKVDAMAQDELALAKSRRHMSQGEWDNYVTQTLDQMTDPAAEAQAAKRFAAAQKLHEDWITTLRDEMLAKNPELKAGVDTHQPLDKQLQTLRSMDPSGDAELAASNRLYEHHLVVIREKMIERATLLRQFEATKDGNLLAKAEGLSAAIRRFQGQSAMFANEAYFSEGAVVHVVGDLQEDDPSKKMDVSAQMALQSFNEQFGDFLKDLSHYKTDGEAFYRSAKYLGRFADAFKKLKAEPGVTFDAGLDGEIASLQGLSAQLMPIRSGKPPYNAMSDEQKAQKAGEIVGSDSGSYKARIMALSQKVNAQFRSGGKQKGDK